MNKATLKIIATIFLGIVFLLGGVGTASAQGVCTDPTIGAPYTTNTASECNGTWEATATAGTGAITSSGLPPGPSTITTNDSTAGLLVKSLTCDGPISCLMWIPTVGPTIVLYGIYKIISFVLLLCGMLFDYSLSLSLDKNFVVQPFIDSIWTIMRDFSNMLFIFILIYTGIQTMLGMGNWRKTVLNVIIVALLINFSLFFTKVVIDAGNILAVGVYEAMGPTPPAGGQREISSSLTRSFEPQKFVQAASVGDASQALLVFAIAIVVNAVVAWAFFTTALVFIGRLLAFWFLMIISPFAFISTSLPKGNIFGWWTSTLLSQSFLAPVFLFCMYIIMKIVNDPTGILSTLQTGGLSGGNISSKLLVPVLTATLLVVAIIKSKDLAKKMGGEFGELGAKIAGTALGLAAGGTALAGQKVIGRAATWAGKQEGFKQFAAKSPIGRVAYSLTDKTANAAFDVRNLPMADKLGLGKGQQGSYGKTVKEAKEADIAFGKKIMFDKDGKPIEGIAEAYQAQLEKGYITRLGTGGNVGAAEAAKSVKDEQKKAAKKEQLKNQQKEKTAEFKRRLNVAETADLDSKEVSDATEKTIAELEVSVAKAEAQLEYVKQTMPSDTDAHAEASVIKKKAERDLKKFENTRSEIEKIGKELKELEEKKEEKKKEEKKEEKH